MPFIEADDGVHLYVQDLGRGAPVVLLAGFGMSHPVWDSEVRSLVEAGHRAICIDLRGTGRSDKPAGGYDVPRLAADVAAVFEALDLHEVALGGWSFGGQVSLRLAEASPDRIARLILVCSNGVRASRSEAFPFGPPADPLYDALTRGERADRLTARRKTIASGFAAADPDPHIVDFLVGVSLQMPSWAAIASYDSYLRTDLVHVVPKLTVPVLQILGAADVVTPLDGAAWLQERLPDSRLVVLDGCGHYPMFEATVEFDAALVSFAGG